MNRTAWYRHEQHPDRRRRGADPPLCAACAGHRGLAGVRGRYEVVARNAGSALGGGVLAEGTRMRAADAGSAVPDHRSSA